MAQYTVVKGDALYKIAGKYGITLNDLEAANPQIQDFNLIYPGQVITIPEKSVTLDVDNTPDHSGEEPGGGFPWGTVIGGLLGVTAVGLTLRGFKKGGRRRRR